MNMAKTQINIDKEQGFFCILISYHLHLLVLFWYQAAVWKLYEKNILKL